MTDSIRSRLFSLREADFAAFQHRLTPTLDPQTILGVRMPALRKLAKEIHKSALKAEFLCQLPHDYLEENLLHGLLIGLEKDFDAALEKVEQYLPYVDSWMTCDSLSPAVFAKHPDKLLPAIDRWLSSSHEYTIRFGLLALMRYHLDAHFDPAYLDRAVLSDERYYVRMMVAWFFATALAKQYAHALPYLENRRLDAWTHNKTIQKAIESYRISPEQKAYLKTLRIAERNKCACRTTP